MRAFDEGIYRKSETRGFKRRYFIAFEGRTEYEYFKGIKDNKAEPSVGIPSSIDIQCLGRFDQNSGDSNPKSIMSVMGEYRHLVKTGEYTVRMFVYTVMQDVFDVFCSSLGKKERMECGRKLHRLQSLMIERLNDSDYSKDGMIIINKWDSAACYCREMIDESEFNGLGDYISTPKDRKVETLDEETDTFCLIVDRDKKSNPTKQYYDLIRECERNKVRLCISNPSIEFWLILHHEKSIKMGDEACSKLLENEKSADGKRTYAEQVLIDLFGSYNKSHVDFKGRFMKRMNSAIDNAESYETELTGLEGKLGSNIGRLIIDMRSSE